MKIKTFIVDAFTDSPFRGNAAGVCLLEKPLQPEVMQQIASELKHSETAFVTLTPNEKGQLGIRYFTPTVEVTFCGHATLASSKVILDKLDQQQVNFLTHHGLSLSAKKNRDQITMLFPLYSTSPDEVNPQVLKALGLDDAIDVQFAPELDMLVLQVANKQTIEHLHPDFIQLVKADPTIKELVVTCRSADNEYDFYSRCFCPWIGIDEDPVTGAAHSVLAKYWGKILNKTEMRAFQCSERGGYMNVLIKSEHELEVTSRAHIVLEGEINLQ